MKAILTNYRQSPRKVGLIAGLIRGKKVSEALTTLQFTVKRASSPIEKLLRSAIANAKNTGIDDPMNLYVTEVRVDKGIVLKRWMPRARGNAAEILKRSSNVILVLGEKIQKGKAAAKAAKSDKETKTKNK
jgi:large subunit ribosomal protein L22